MRRGGRIFGLGIAFLMVASIPVMAQLPRLPRVPDAGDVAGEVLRGRIPGLDKILKEEPGLTTSLEDAVYGVSILDGFDPPVAAPMYELPLTDDGTYLVALPGVFEMAAQSFCLHAGTHGPGHGEGYLWAPLKGRDADIISDILSRYGNNRHLDQSYVQALIWGVQARAKFSDMTPELREAARTLLTPDQLRRLNGGALGQVPEELFNQAFVDMPPQVRMVLEAEARLRDRLTRAAFDFHSMAEVAVLDGEPPVDLGGPEIPRGRWSYEPGGFFVRFDPHGFLEMKLELYAPESFKMATDTLGRITSLTDRSECTIEVEYTASEPVIATGDVSVAAHTLERVTLHVPGASPVELRAGDQGIVLTGVPSGEGSFTGRAADLYNSAVSAVADVRQLASNVEGASPDSSLHPWVTNLAHLSRGIDTLIRQAGPSNHDYRVIAGVSHRATASMLALMLGGMEAATASLDAHGETQLAMLPWATGAIFDLGRGAAGFDPRRPTTFDPNNPNIRWPHIPRPPGDLDEFDPGGGTAVPANPGQQRLGAAPVPDPDRPPKPDLEQARNRIARGGLAFDIFEWVTDPIGKVALGVPNWVFGKMMDMVTDAWATAARLLGIDPPVPDYSEIAVPEPIELPETHLEIEISPEHTRAAMALVETMLDNLALVRAANITEDRLGGAWAARDHEWTQRQAAAFIDYLRRVGEGKLEIADRIDAVLEALYEAGIDEVHLTEELVIAYQQRLRDYGFSEAELEAARILSVSDAELQELRSRRISTPAEELAGDLLYVRQQYAEDLRTVGSSWTKLPLLEPRD